ncbi:MAG: LysR family transcriptional regulator [Verrucomicrobia bacterium]|nr:LysR family transcriptional regulator [Verrucomicrobiota bacterium]
MELRQLRVFQTVARTGSVVAAAAELHLTASALSHALKALETELGCRLFDRAGKGLHLNAAGERFLADIELPLAGLGEATEHLRQRVRGGYKRLRIGAAASACKHILPRVIRDLQKAFPRVEVRIESGDAVTLAELLKANAVDLVLSFAPENEAGLRVHPVFNDELLCTCAPSHRWADGRVLTPEDLAAQPFILYQRHSVTARLVASFLRGLGVTTLTVMEVGSIEAIKEFVQLDLGVAVLPPWVAERELRRGVLRMRPFGPTPLRREWSVFHRASRKLTPVEGRFIRLCRAHAAGLRLDRNDLAGLGRR